MKVLVVLGLVVLTGCNASPLNADRPEPKPKVEEKNMAPFYFLLAFVKAADHTYIDFRRTDFGSAVMRPLENAAINAGVFLHTVAEHLSPTTKAIIERSVEASFKLASDVYRYTFKNHLRPMAISAAPVMEEALVQLFEGSQLVQDAVSPYITELMERVDPIFQNIQARLHELKNSYVKSV